MKSKARKTVLIIALLICMGCTHITADVSKDASRIFRGKIQVMIADDFKDDKATTAYYLISSEDGAVLRLNFIEAPPASTLKSGTQVEIEGRRHGDRLDAAVLRVRSPEKR